MRSCVRQEGTHSIDDADQVHVQNPAPVVEGDMVDASQNTNPGVVAQDVDFAEGRKGRLGSGVYGNRIGNVADNTPYLPPGT